MDTTAAYNDKLWDENSTEALQNFGLQGTPGNAVIDVKTGKYKAIGGAYPQSAFEEVIAKLQAGETLTTDDMGQAGTLTKDVLQKILKGAHYYGEEKAGIVVVEYSDILCPFCQRHFNAKTIEICQLLVFTQLHHLELRELNVQDRSEGQKHIMLT